MAASASPMLLSFSFRNTHFRALPRILNSNIFPSISYNKQSLVKPKLSLEFKAVNLLQNRLLSNAPFTPIRAISDRCIDSTENEETLHFFEERPDKFMFWVVFWACLSLAWFAVSGDSNAAVDSIKTSSFGLKIASVLQGSGWPDEAVVFALATLPVLELRGAIPVGYWMQLKPITLTVLAVTGNMVPVPFIIIYLKRFASVLAGTNKSASRFLDMLFENAKQKAALVEEFQWLGLMLFVAVPFPGTGAWTGAIIAAILDMPFWSAVSANFFGVVGAGLLVNLLVNLGLKYAIITGSILFLISTFMWSILRNIKKTLSSSN